MRHTRSEIPDILIPIGYLAAFAVCAAGYGLGLSPVLPAHRQIRLGHGIKPTPRR
jgi:hypothetical protein